MNKVQDINNNTSIKNVSKIIFKVAMPMALQSVLLSLVQLVDNLFIGHLESATDVAAGINAINNISFIITAIVTGFIAGIGVYFAQAAGKSDNNLQKKLFITKIIYMLFWSALLISIVIIFLKDISKIWLPNDENISKAVGSAYNYGLFIFPSLLIDYFVLIFSSSFKEKKKTCLATSIAVVAILINSSLNYPLMYIFKLGVKGSAIATLIARIAELFIWAIYVFFKKPDFLPKFRDWFKLKVWSTLVMVFKKSFLWMINAFAGSLAFTLQIMFMSRISIDAAASLNSAGVIAQMIYSFTGGYAAATGIITMHTLVKNSRLNIKLYVHKVQLITILFGLIMGIILASFCWSVFYIYPNYNHNTKLQSMIMLLSIASTVWIGLWTSVYLSTLKGLGHAKSILIFDGIYSWVISFPLTVILVYTVSDSMQFGYIYWIVGASAVFKPISFMIYFLKQKNFNVLISPNESKLKEIYSN